MSEFTYPLDGEQNYSAAQAGAFNGTRTSGVWSGDDNLSVKVSSATTLLLSKGLAWFTTDMYWGKVYCNTESIAFVPPAADAALDCIYRIILRWNKTANAVAAMLVAGELSSNPVAPQRNTSNEVFDLVLAEYYQTHGESQLNPMNLTDTRLNENLCGLMRDGVTRLPSDTLYLQYNEALAQLRRAISEAWEGQIPVSSVTFDMLSPTAKTLAWENITVPDSAWAESTDFQNYPWRAAIPLPSSGVDATYLPTVDFTEESKAAVDLGPDAVSYAGGVYIYAASAPEVLVKLNTLACEPTLVETLASSVFASIAVTYAAGKECSCTDGTTTLTAKSTSGKWTFAIPYAGTWLISDGENEQSVSITTEGQSVSVELSRSITYLYNMGDECTDVTGGWELYQSAGTVTREDDFIAFVSGASGTVRALGTANAIDLTAAKTLTVDARVTFEVGAPQNYYFGVSTEKAISSENSVLIPYSTGFETITLNVSNLTGEHYFFFTNSANGDMATASTQLRSAWLE